MLSELLGFKYLFSVGGGEWGVCLSAGLKRETSHMLSTTTELQPSPRIHRILAYNEHQNAVYINTLHRCTLCEGGLGKKPDTVIP